MADWNTCPDAFCPRRRRMPLAVICAQTSVPVASHACGHAEHSPWKRYFRLLISAVPFSVQVFDCASANDVAPGAWAVKSGLALVVPPMPDSSFAAWIFPAIPGNPLAD